jgi:adenylylsulfate kinase
MHIETTLRSIAKAISCRVSSTLMTSAIVWVVTGRGQLALLVGSLDAVLKVAAAIAHKRVGDRVGAGKRERRAAVVWLTGLPGAGKTTIAKRVTAELERCGIKVEHLDGDAVRDIFPSTGFSRKDRDEHIRRVGFLASRLERHGIVVIASFVSPFEDARAFARSLCRTFIEVYVATPLVECERRDPKGLYQRARVGAIREFTGVDSPYEEPTHPEIRIDTGETDPESAARIVVGRVLASGVGRPVRP